MRGRLTERLLYGLLFAMILLGGMQLLANRIEPPNRGMSETPCPAAIDRTTRFARTVFLTLAGRPDESRDWADLCFYRADNDALLRRGIRPDAIFLGDSITQYWGRFETQPFSEAVLNRGLAGQASPQILLRLQPDALALKPRVIHLMVGLNDVVGIRGWSRPDEYRNNVEAMLTLAKAAGVTIVIGAILPAKNDGWSTGVEPVARIRELNAWLRAIAQRDGLVFADYWAAMAAPDGTMRHDLADDGVHPNAAGYAVMTPIAQRSIALAEQRSMMIAPR